MKGTSQNWFKEERSEIRNFYSDPEHKYLSNMQILDKPIIIAHIEFFSSEAAYQSCKFSDIETKRLISQMPPKKSKVFAKEQFDLKGKDHILDSSFMPNRLKYMQSIVLKKFENNPELLDKLISTNDKTLIEGNWWKDNYWGVDHKTGWGANNLGIILMNTRIKLCGLCHDW